MEAVENFEELKSNGFPPSVRLHPLSGNRKGEWAIDIHKTSGWRITFRFEQSEFVDVKVEDYHSEELMKKFSKKRPTRKPSHPGEILKVFGWMSWDIVSHTLRISS